MKTHVEYVGLDKAAEILDFASGPALKKWCLRQRKKGTLPIPIFAIGNRWRFRRSDLDSLGELLHDAQVGPEKASVKPLKLVGGSR